MLITVGGLRRFDGVCVFVACVVCGDLRVFLGGVDICVGRCCVHTHR